MRISDKNFRNQLKMKDEEALEYVLDNYGWIIKATVKKHLYGLESHQGECINDILLAIWNNIDSFDEDRSEFKNWLAGVAKYKSIDYKRKYLKNSQYDNIEDLDISIDDSVHNEITSKELNQDLEELLNCLKKEDRELFLKLYVEEKDMDEISKETGLKKDVIYNRLSRGKMKLRKLFKIVESRG